MVQDERLVDRILVMREIKGVEQIHTEAKDTSASGGYESERRWHAI